MATTLPLPPPQVPLMDNSGKPTQQGFEFLDRLQRLVKQLNPVIAVAVPTNANAATAGVTVGGLYRDTADPAKVYVRTV